MRICSSGDTSSSSLCRGCDNVPPALGLSLLQGWKPSQGRGWFWHLKTFTGQDVRAVSPQPVLLSQPEPPLLLHPRGTRGWSLPGAGHLGNCRLFQAVVSIQMKQSHWGE